MFFVLFISSCGFDEVNDENVFGTNSSNQNITTLENETEDDVNQSGNETSDEVEHTEQTCLDTDGGLDYEEMGMTIVSNGKFRQVSDRCEGDYALIEYYCDGIELGIQSYGCAGLGLYNCTNGACVQMNATNQTNST